MAEFTQDDRVMTIDTPLGKDALFLIGLEGVERMSGLFEFHLDLISENHNIAFKSIVGENVTIAMLLADGSKRFINGIISRFSQGRGGGESDTSDARFSHYSAAMVPWPWLLTRTADSRIFQEKSVTEIIEQIFSEKSFTDYSIRLQGSYDPRTYCVQYRETDFNFISRLMEDEGMFYFFEHEDGKHTLVIADAPAENKPCPKQAEARYQITGGGWLEEDVVTTLNVAQEIQVGKFAINDYNFEVPTTKLLVDAAAKKSLGPGEREVYDYPGKYTVRDRGDTLVNVRMEEHEARMTTLEGASDCRAFFSGSRFRLIDYYRRDMDNKEYLITAVSHKIVSKGEFPSIAPDPTGAGFNYSNRFTCIPHEVPFRPRRETPKPFIRGTQTAIVTGPGGEEIYTDEYGRVKVQFHWDREGKRDENSSCWIRVSQVWAGTNWGAMYIPRIGHEVIVDFLEGDPDQPIVTGRVYHGINMPPYGLPGEKTKSTLKSNSSLGGGGYNEFRYEDKKGQEEIYLHGQKDWTIVIENDKNQSVGHDETLFVGHDQTISIANNRDKTVGVNQTEKIGVNKTIAVGANHGETIGANMNQTVAAAKAETIGAAKALTIGAAYQVSVGAAMNESIGAAKAEEIGAAKSVNVGADSSENVGKNKSVDAGDNISESAGKNVSIQSGKQMSLTSGDNFSISGNKNGIIEIKDQLTIKVGKATITLKKNGDITIDGKTINVKGSGNIVMKAQKILEN